MAQPVVIDSSVFQRDWLLKRYDWEIFKNAKLHEFFVVLPEVVLAEHESNYRKRISDQLAIAAKAYNKLEALGIEINAIKPEDSEILDRFWRKYHNQWISELEKAGLTMWPLPKVKHDELMNMDLEKKMPFSSKGGYRDALIWHSVLEIGKHCGDPGEVVFVSYDRDFTNPKGDALAPNLIADAKKAGISVTWFKDLQSLVTNLDEPKLDASKYTEEFATNEAMQRMLVNRLDEGLCLRPFEISDAPFLESQLESEGYWPAGAWTLGISHVLSKNVEIFAQSPNTYLGLGDMEAHVYLEVECEPFHYARDKKTPLPVRGFEEDAFIRFEFSYEPDEADQIVDARIVEIDFYGDEVWV